MTRPRRSRQPRRSLASEVEGPLLARPRPSLWPEPSAILYLIKAAAGGGGKGNASLPRVERAWRGPQTASSEAEAAFKNASVYLVLHRPACRGPDPADSHGEIVLLGPRLHPSRRRQLNKESSPTLPAKVRTVSEAAVRFGEKPPAT